MLGGIVWPIVLKNEKVLDVSRREGVESCERVRLVLELFKAKGCGMVINAGDIADHHYPAGYAAYRQVFDGVFAGGPKPREIYAYAWHDAYDYQGHSRDAVEDDAVAAFGRSS